MAPMPARFHAPDERAGDAVVNAAAAARLMSIAMMQPPGDAPRRQQPAFILPLRAAYY